MKNRIDKPWGYEETLESNSEYLFKKLFMKQGHKCSLQYHNHKTETLYVVTGSLIVTLSDPELKDFKVISMVLHPGDHLTIKSGVTHRMEANTDCTYLESSSPFPDDTVRVEDDYGRN